MSRLSINKQGLTLIEAMVAIAILGIGIFAMASVFANSAKVNKNAEQNTVAAALAQEKIESLIALGYDNCGSGTVESRHRLASLSTNPFYAYERQTVINYVDANLNISAAATKLKLATVDVYWRGAATKSTKVKTLKILLNGQ